MNYYLFSVSYSTEGCAALAHNPQDRMEGVRGTVESLGGKIESFWFALGEVDVIFICQMPDNAAAAALSIAVGSGGAVDSFNTTPLLTIEEGMEAMKEAGQSGYKPPK